jgi:PAS domain-containing protein
MLPMALQFPLWGSAMGEALKGADVLLDALTRQRALLDGLFARVPEAIVLLDTDDRVLQVNPEFTRVFGYAQEEACGRLISELVVPMYGLAQAAGWIDSDRALWSQCPVQPISYRGAVPSRSCSAQYTKSLVRPCCWVNAWTSELWNCHAEGPLICD